MFYLNELIKGSLILHIESKPFIDIHETFEHSINVESLKNEPLFSCQYQDYVKNLIIPEENPLSLSRLSEFMQLDEKTTESFLKNCKLNKSTVQGAFSIAVTLVLMNEKINLSDIDEPTTCLNCIPCNMRYLFDLKNDDLIYSVGNFSWNQVIKNKHQRVWDLISDATKTVHELKDSNEGLKWWVKFKHSIQYQEATVVSSSMGFIDLEQEKLDVIKLKELRFFTSTYESKPNLSNFMIAHTFTFLKKLYFNLSYVYPNMNRKWARNFAENLYKIIEHLSKKDSESTNLIEISKILHKI